MEKLEMWLVVSYPEVGTLIREMLKRILPGTTLVIFQSPEEVMRRMELEDTKLPDIIACDQLFLHTDMKGGDFLAWIRKTWLVIFTIHMSSSLAPHQSAGNAFLAKPFQLVDMEKSYPGGWVRKKRGDSDRGGRSLRR